MISKLRPSPINKSTLMCSRLIFASSRDTQNSNRGQRSDGWILWDISARVASSRAAAVAGSRFRKSLILTS